MNSSRILVVDDDDAVREMISDALVLAGYEVTKSSNGREAIETLRSYPADLIVTDVNMPVMDGYKLVEKLRANGNSIPVIFLTARNEKPDVTQGLKLGADDYITKPFGLEELSLRISAILRRTKTSNSNESQLTCGPVQVNLTDYSVHVNSQEIQLSPTEFRLLTYLMENKNIVLTKHQLLDEVWGMGFAESASVVDTFISYLRKKIHVEGFAGIKTIRGVGFKITDSK